MYVIFRSASRVLALASLVFHLVTWFHDAELGNG